MWGACLSIWQLPFPIQMTWTYENTHVTHASTHTHCVGGYCQQEVIWFLSCTGDHFLRGRPACTRTPGVSHLCIQGLDSPPFFFKSFFLLDTHIHTLTVLCLVCFFSSDTTKKRLNWNCNQLLLKFTVLPSNFPQVGCLSSMFSKSAYQFITTNQYIKKCIDLLIRCWLEEQQLYVIFFLFTFSNILMLAMLN